MSCCKSALLPPTISFLCICSLILPLLLFFPSQECGGPILRGRWVVVFLGYQGGARGVCCGLLAPISECLHVYKQTGSFAWPVCLCGFFFEAHTSKHTAGNTGLLITSTDLLINPASMNVGACVGARRLCTSEQLRTLFFLFFLIKPRGVMEVNSQIIMNCRIVTQGGKHVLYVKAST